MSLCVFTSMTSTIRRLPARTDRCHWNHLCAQQATQKRSSRRHGSFLKEPTHTHVRRLGLSHNFIFFHTYIETETASGQTRLLKQVRAVIRWQRTAHVQPAAHWGSHKTRLLALIHPMTPNFSLSAQGTTQAHCGGPRTTGDTYRRTAAHHSR